MAESLTKWHVYVEHDEGATDSEIQTEALSIIQMITLVDGYTAAECVDIERMT